ncbi:hypothetical protein HPB47_024093 [Ixodes persulcatus]|uniref:Uncharacterized protein n=1 Tax=Ixodes persulcatus TaxID=34615 RepID=A0AC60Q589_IXOPE|nr:hypothetical protein HPB47_024093 [Ixodes persulcatus]
MSSPIRTLHAASSTKTVTCMAQFIATPSATKKPLLRLRADGLGCRVPGIVAGCGERCGTAKTIYENALLPFQRPPVLGLTGGGEASSTGPAPDDIMTSSQVNGSIAASVSGGPSIITTETSRMEIEAGNPLGKASGGETRRIRESSVSKKRKGEDLTKEDVVIEAKEEDMERSGCNDEYGSSNEEYTVIVKPTAAVNITNTESWLLWSTFRKILSSPCENDQIGYAVSNGNNSIAVTVRTEQHAQDLMSLKELPTEDPDKKIEVSVYRSTTGSQPRGVIHGVSPGDAARGIVENAIADYHDIIHARPIGKNGTYLITFEGQGIPRSLRLFGRYHNVFPYKPTAVVCLQCHGLGHKATVCTRKQRCKTCGEVHPNNQPYQGKYCPNCKKTGHTVFEMEACQARNRADDKLQKRAADGRRNHGGGPVATAAKKGGASNRAPYNPDGFPSLTPQEQQQAEQRKPKPTYSQALDSKAMISHLGTPSGYSSRLATELAQLRESSSRILQKIQRWELEYENQLRQEQETRRAQAKATAEADRKRKQEAEQRLRIEQQKADEARRRSQRCPVTYEQVLEKKEKEAEVAGARPNQQTVKPLWPHHSKINNNTRRRTCRRRNLTRETQAAFPARPQAAMISYNS